MTVLLSNVMDLNHLLLKMKEFEASDLYLSTGAPPCIKINGILTPLDSPAFVSGEIKAMAYALMDSYKTAQFEKNLEMNLALHDEKLGRFRVNIFVAKNEVAMVIRRIQLQIPTSESLGLPPIVKDIIMESRGLVLFVGATGCGKSTSLACLIDYRNENSAGHIVTIEDPIEFMHPHKKSIVNQREIGLDTLSYQNALENTLRQAPDVILIGEIRSQDAMEQAIAFSETGHLCLSTLHANNANQAFDRIINFFPEERRNQILLDLSFNVRAIISQRLVNTVDNRRTAAVEILLGSPLILSLIRRGEIDALKEVMERSTNIGMQTLDQSLEKLYVEGKITIEEALRNADSKNNLRLKISLNDKAPATEKNADALQMEPLEVDLSGQDENTPFPEKEDKIELRLKDEDV